MNMNMNMNHTLYIYNNININININMKFDNNKNNIESNIYPTTNTFISINNVFHAHFVIYIYWFLTSVS